MRKICHSFCPFSSGKIFLFCMENLSCRLSSFLRCSPCSTIPLFTCFSVLYRILLLFGRSGDGVVVWVLSCCAERFSCGVLFWNTSFFIPNEFLFDYIRNVIANRMILCAGCEQDWCCSEMWTGAYLWDECGQEYGRECVQSFLLKWSWTGDMVERKCGDYYSSFGFHLLRAFFLMFFMEFGINPSYVFRCFLRDDSEWNSRRGSVCCTVLSELCGQTDVVKWGERTERCCYTVF